MLASCGGGTKLVEKPVLPEPCRVGEPPDLPPVEFVACSFDAEGNLSAACTSPAELDSLAVWVTALGEWVGDVRSCPFVQFTRGDIRKAMGVEGDSLGGGKTP